MTVSELIKNLQSMPGDAEVMVPGPLGRHHIREFGVMGRHWLFSSEGQPCYTGPGMLPGGFVDLEAGEEVKPPIATMTPEFQKKIDEANDQWGKIRRDFGSQIVELAKTDLHLSAGDEK